MSPIQQQLSEVNHRYSLLGVKLSDRNQEINSFSDEIKIYLDSLKNLLNFVQTKERQMPKDPLPVTRDQAAKQLQLLKVHFHLLILVLIISNISLLSSIFKEKISFFLFNNNKKKTVLVRFTHFDCF